MPNCHRCEADPQPKDFATPRVCAFPSDSFGKNPREILFSPENWNCATVGALLDAHDEQRKAVIYGNDESLDLVPGVCVVADDGEPPLQQEPYGWLVLTRYKRRGKLSSAIFVGDFFPPQLVSLALVEATISYLTQQKGRR